MPLSDVDDDLLLAALGWLDPTDVWSCALVCRRWRRLTSTRALWRGMLRMRWPKIASAVVATCRDERGLVHRLARDVQRR